MKTMPNSTKEEKYRWIKPILDKEITIKNMAKICPFSKRALKYWLAAFREYGMEGLENKSTRPKSHPKETPIRIKERIIELRKETKKCALKLQWDLKDEGINIYYQTIHKIIKKEGLTRRYNKLSPQMQSDYDDRAKNLGLTTTLDGKVQGDGELLYALEEEGVSNAFGGSKQVTPMKKTDTTSRGKGVTINGKKVDNLTVSKTVKYGGETFDNFYSTTDNKIKISDSYQVVNAEEQIDDEWGKKQTKNYSDLSIVGVNMKNGKADDILLSVKEDKFQKTPNGEYIYELSDFTGTAKEILDKMKARARANGATESDLKNHTISYVESNASRIRTEGKDKVIRAKAQDNPDLLKTFAVNGREVKPYISKEQTYSVNGKQMKESELLNSYKTKYPNKTEEQLLEAIRKQFGQ